MFQRLSDSVSKYSLYKSRSAQDVNNLFSIGRLAALPRLARRGVAPPGGRPTKGNKQLALLLVITATGMPTVAMKRHNDTLRGRLEATPTIKCAVPFSLALPAILAGEIEPFLFAAGERCCLTCQRRHLFVYTAAIMVVGRAV